QLREGSTRGSPGGEVSDHFLGNRRSALHWQRPGEGSHLPHRWPRGFGQAPSPELNGEPGARKFTCQPETSVPNSDAWPELPPQDALDPYLFHLSQSLVCGLSDLA